MSTGHLCSVKSCSAGCFLILLGVKTFKDVTDSSHQTSELLHLNKNIDLKSFSGRLTIVFFFLPEKL